MLTNFQKHQIDDIVNNKLRLLYGINSACFSMDEVVFSEVKKSKGYICNDYHGLSFTFKNVFTGTVIKLGDDSKLNIYSDNYGLFLNILIMKQNKNGESIELVLNEKFTFKKTK